jgi:lipoate---protein ligase
MELLDLTLPTLAENLALDEALLDEAEADAAADDVLRLWESPELAIVLGRASRRSEEVDLVASEVDGVPVVRRTSGGCAVVIGPGCLLYSLVLSYERHPELRILDKAHRFVMGALRRTLARHVPDVRFAGTCDLTFSGRKFSGNSLRCKRSHLLYHGTLLYDFPLELMERYLRRPPREPEYRQGRRHSEFITNFPLLCSELRRALRETFAAYQPRANWPSGRTEALVASRYSQAAWHAER